MISPAFSSFLRLFWLFVDFCGSIQILELYLLVLWKMPWIFWYGFSWIYRFLWMVWTLKPLCTIYGNISAATKENSMDVPHKIKKWTTIWPNNSSSRYLSEEIENTNWKSIFTPVLIVALFTVARMWKLSVVGWMDKEDVVYIYKKVEPGETHISGCFGCVSKCYTSHLA